MEHLNRRERVGIAFSLCGRYLATGSEDNSAYVYDLRAGKLAARLGGRHRDCVAGLAYSPCYPQLVTASYDGTLRCWEGS